MFGFDFGNPGKLWVPILSVLVTDVLPHSKLRVGVSKDSSKVSKLNLHHLSSMSEHLLLSAMSMLTPTTSRLLLSTMPSWALLTVTTAWARQVNIHCGVTTRQGFEPWFLGVSECAYHYTTGWTTPQ